MPEPIGGVIMAGIFLILTIAMLDIIMIAVKLLVMAILMSTLIFLGQQAISTRSVSYLSKNSVVNMTNLS